MNATATVTVTSTTPYTGTEGVGSDKLRPHKPGTKGYYAKVWREAARIIGAQRTILKGLVFSANSNTYCAIGALAQVACGRPRSAYVETKLIGDSGPVYHSASLLWDAVYPGARSTFLARVIGVNDNEARSPAEVAQFMRGVAYMLDHANKLPPFAKKLVASRETIPFGGVQ